MRKVKLSDLMTNSRRYADMENDDFISDVELVRYINVSCLKYWDLINSTSQDFNIKESNVFSFVSGQNSYDLPSDFLYIRGVDACVETINTENVRWFNIDNYTFRERNKNRNTYYFGNYYYNDYYSMCKYRIVNNSIRFDFVNNQTLMGSFKIWYIPVVPDLQNLNDEIDGIHGFDEYICLLTASRMKAKEETDNSWLEKEIFQCEERIRAALLSRNRDKTEKIEDIYANVSGGYYYGL